MVSKNIILVLMYHRHKLSDLIYGHMGGVEPCGFSMVSLNGISFAVVTRLEASLVL
jgi:hypothetical protein